MPLHVSQEPGKGMDENLPPRIRAQIDVPQKKGKSSKFEIGRRTDRERLLMMVVAPLPSFGGDQETSIGKKGGEGEEEERKRKIGGRKNCGQEFVGAKNAGLRTTEGGPTGATGTKDCKRPRGKGFEGVSASPRRNAD